MGGRETVEKLLQIDSNVKAVVSSGYPDDPVMTNFREYGFAAVISKPFRVSELNNALLLLACA
jgi:DNA-binding NarL/FixJ family response regulator